MVTEWKLNLGSIVTLVASILASIISVSVFITAREARITSIEYQEKEFRTRLEREEAIVREMYPKLERLNTNVDWLVKNNMGSKPPQD